MKDTENQQLTWPNVCPKFKVALTPLSFSSNETTSALFSHDRLIAYAKAFGSLSELLIYEIQLIEIQNYNQASRLILAFIIEPITKKKCTGTKQATSFTKSSHRFIIPTEVAKKKGNYIYF